MPEILFPIRFVCFGSLLVYCWDALAGGVVPRTAQDWTIAGVVALTRLVGLRPQVEPGFVVAFEAGAFRYTVSEGCTAGAVAALLVGGAIAFPTTWANRGQWFALSLPLLACLNVLRLTSMAWIGVHWPTLFRQTHEVWWQATMFLAVVGGWLVWSRGRNERHEPASTFRRIGWFVGLFIGIATAIGIIGAMVGLGEAYGRSILWVAVRLTAARIDLEANQAARDDFFAMYLAGLACTIALFAATHWLAPRNRLLGILGFALPSQAAIHVAALTVRILVAQGSVRPTAELMALWFLAMQAGTTAVWWIWERRVSHRQATFRTTRCSACDAEAGDIRDHIRRAHRRDRHRLLRRLRATESR